MGTILIAGVPRHRRPAEIYAAFVGCPETRAADVSESSLMVIANRCVAESKEMAVQCDGLSWEFVDTSRDLSKVIEHYAESR